MATTTSEAEVHSEPLNFKTWVLKVSIHCVGCKKKVKKLLNSVPGVSTIDIDAKQHRVVVTGNVEGDALLRKLLKSGKHAELLLPEKNHPETSAPNTQLQNENSSKDIPQTKDAKQPPLDTSKTTQIAAGGGGSSGNSVKNIEGVSAGNSSSSSGTKATAAADKSIKVDKLTEESKVEEKKPETDLSGNQKSPPVVEVKDGQPEKSVGGGGGGGGGGSGIVGKKKKKKGPNGNSAVAEPLSAESPNRSGGPPPPPAVSSNGSPPHHYGYSYPPPGPQPSHYYGPPPAPVYGVSYNTAQPSSSYTASYYASPPPQSYAYSYPGQEMGPPHPPPPSVYDSYPRQPLDSFEMFSDENPNGCSVM